MAVSRSRCDLKVLSLGWQTTLADKLEQKMTMMTVFTRKIALNLQCQKNVTMQLGLLIVRTICGYVDSLLYLMKATA